MQVSRILVAWNSGSTHHLLPTNQSQLSLRSLTIIQVLLLVLAVEKTLPRDVHMAKPAREIPARTLSSESAGMPPKAAAAKKPKRTVQVHIIMFFLFKFSLEGVACHHPSYFKEAMSKNKKKLLTLPRRGSHMSGRGCGSDAFASWSKCPPFLLSTRHTASRSSACCRSRCSCGGPCRELTWLWC